MNKKTAALFSAAFLAAAALPAAAIAMPSICVKPDPDCRRPLRRGRLLRQRRDADQKNGLYGYAEFDGKIIIPPQYQDAADNTRKGFRETENC